MWLSSPYKGHDDLNVPVPIVNIERGSFYVRGTDAGAFLWKNESQAFSLGISYSELFFDAGKTKNHNLKKRDNRHSTLNAFLQYTLYSPYGHASIQLLRAPLITPTLSAARHGINILFRLILFISPSGWEFAGTASSNWIITTGFPGVKRKKAGSVDTVRREACHHLSLLTPVGRLLMTGASSRAVALFS